MIVAIFDLDGTLYTGHIVQGIVRHHRGHQVKRLPLGDGAIIWSESYVYADTYTDLPLLEQVGYPVAVYPDDELVVHAQDRGWKIIR